MKYYDMLKNKFIEEGKEEKEEDPLVTLGKKKTYNISPKDYIRWLTGAIAAEDGHYRPNLENKKIMFKANKHSKVKVHSSFEFELSFYEVEKTINEILNQKNPIGYLIQNVELPTNIFLIKDIIGLCYLGELYSKSELDFIKLVAEKMNLSDQQIEIFKEEAKKEFEHQKMLLED